jgi:SNF2 family DNA or RNA helicase
VAYPMGLGKTLLAVEIVRRMPSYGPGSRVLVVAPLNTFPGWGRTIQSQIPGAQVHVYPPGGSSSKGAQLWMKKLEAEQPGFYLIGWEAFRGMPDRKERAKRKEMDRFYERMGMKKPQKRANRSWAPTGEWTAVVADEVHRAAERKSATALALKSVRTKVRLALSGTPAGNKVEGYFSVAQWLWPQTFHHFWPWAMEFCDTVRDDHAGRRVLGEKEPGAIVRSFPLYLRHEVADVMPELPRVSERVITVPLKRGDQTRVYNELEEQAFTWLEDHSLSTELPITQSLRLRQVALAVPTIVEREVPVYQYRDTRTGEVFDKDASEIAWLHDHTRRFKKEHAGTATVQEVDYDTFTETAKSNKIDAMLEILKDVDPAEPVLVLTHSARFIKPVVHQLNAAGFGPAVAWSGGTSAQGRQRIMRDFGKVGGPRIIVAGIAAIGEGVDGLQHVCNHEIWLSQHDNNMLNQQAAARLLRGGQKRMVNRWVIQSAGTIDTKVFERLKGNAKQMQAAYRKENPR